MILFPLLTSLQVMCGSVSAVSSALKTTISRLCGIPLGEERRAAHCPSYAAGTRASWEACSDIRAVNHRAGEPSPASGVDVRTEPGLGERCQRSVLGSPDGYSPLINSSFLVRCYPPRPILSLAWLVASVAGGLNQVFNFPRGWR